MNNKQFTILKISNVFDAVSRITTESDDKEYLMLDVHNFFFNFYESNQYIGAKFRIWISDTPMSEEEFKNNEIVYYMKNGYKINNNSSYIYSFSGLLLNCDFDNNFDILQELYCYISIKL